MKYEILKSDLPESNAVALYGKFGAPVIQKFETILPMPVGKNILIIAVK